MGEWNDASTKPSSSSTATAATVNKDDGDDSDNEQADNAAVQEARAQLATLPQWEACVPAAVLHGMLRTSPSTVSSSKSELLLRALPTILEVLPRVREAPLAISLLKQLLRDVPKHTFSRDQLQVVFFSPSIRCIADCLFALFVCFCFNRIQRWVFGRWFNNCQH
jgi:hypothetical protein